MSLYERATRVMPGGVSSPVRAFGAVGGEPRFLSRGDGAYVYDTDGRRYLDLLGSWGPLILGHAHPQVVEAVREAAERGSSFGAPTESEVVLAETIVESVPGIEMVRFVSSGTEAAMSALRVARAATKRDLVLKFAGCYHGHADAMLVHAGSGVATLGLPDSPGVTRGASRDTIVAAYNDPGEVAAVFARRGDDIAAVIVEPVAANMGVVPPLPGFLHALREHCDAAAALLIFDEVVTGFRLARGGAQEITGVTPDLTVLGKVIGGGLPVGAYGGRADLMRLVAPEGPVYQAGTLSGNPLAMAAGLATLRALDDKAYATLDERASQLQDGLSGAGVPLVVQRAGSMLTPFFTDTTVADLASAKRSDRQRYARFFHGMLDAGVYLPPSQLEAAFVSLAHTQSDIAFAVDAAHHVLEEIA